MDFFEHQADAQRRTKLLVFYYLLAVVMIIGAVYLVFALALMYGQDAEPQAAEQITLWDPTLLLWTAVLAGGVIGAGTLFKVASLAGGGKSVAQMMGGTLIDSETTEPAQRRLLNIVEEMAIASGIPVPPVYIIDESGINAFAAGFKPSDAVIGVTRGCLELLNRDEMQGVIAHEFSHILNGDMRLNIRLIGVLFGILLITVIGQVMMRVGLYSGVGRRRSSRSGKNEGGLPIALMVIGVALIIIGSIGVFFGRLIKSAVSRQREFLADAAAVQFTRNPDGIAGALKKIGGYTSRVESVHAEEASHMFFANSLKSSLGGLLATHPPLEERIRRLSPEFIVESGQAQRTDTRAAHQAVQHDAASGLAGTTPPPVRTPEQVTERIGTMDAENLAYAATVIETIPDFIRSAVHTPHGARAALYCLLLSDQADTLKKQTQFLQIHLQEPTRGAVEQLNPDINDLPKAARMPLVELAMPALQQQSQEEYLQFKRMIEQLIAADNEVGIFEFALSRSLIRHLEPVFGQPERIRIVYHNIKQLRPHCLPLLALLARYGNEDDPAQAAADFADGVAHLGGDPQSTPMPETTADPVQLFADTLDILRQADGGVKKQVLNACVAAVAGNQQVTVEEAELLRAVADSLDCPLPPIL